MQFHGRTSDPGQRKPPPQEDTEETGEGQGEAVVPAAVLA